MMRVYLSRSTSSSPAPQSLTFLGDTRRRQPGDPGDGNHSSNRRRAPGVRPRRHRLSGSEYKHYHDGRCNRGDLLDPHPRPRRRSIPGESAGSRTLRRRLRIRPRRVGNQRSERNPDRGLRRSLAREGAPPGSRTCQAARAHPRIGGLGRVSDRGSGPLPERRPQLPGVYLQLLGARTACRPR